MYRDLLDPRIFKKTKYEIAKQTKRTFFCKYLNRQVEIYHIGSPNDKYSYGGYIEEEKNLSHDGDCWIDFKAWVYGGAQIRDNAKVDGTSLVIGENTLILDDALIDENAIVVNAIIRGDAIISGHCKILGQNKNAPLHVPSDFRCDANIVFENQEQINNYVIMYCGKAT